MSRSAVQELAGPVEAAIAEVGGDGVQARLERPADPAHGDYATAAALQLAKPLRAAPRQIAERIVERIDSPFIASMSSFMKRGDRLTRDTTTPGTSSSSTSWSMRANVIVNS